jgi:hypothetical protein
LNCKDGKLLISSYRTEQNIGCEISYDEALVAETPCEPRVDEISNLTVVPLNSNENNVMSVDELIGGVSSKNWKSRKMT